jgi:hypothetical protein
LDDWVAILATVGPRVTGNLNGFTNFWLESVERPKLNNFRRLPSRFLEKKHRHKRFAIPHRHDFAD